jgi:hypothetical protein
VGITSSKWGFHAISRATGDASTARVDALDRSIDREHRSRTCARDGGRAWAVKGGRGV